MSANAVEKQAQKLNQLLRSQGKKLGKTWRTNVRELLARTFEALNAKPLDGALCLALSQKIEAELEALENGETTLGEALPSRGEGRERIGEANSERAAECIGEANSGAARQPVERGAEGGSETAGEDVERGAEGGSETAGEDVERGAEGGSEHEAARIGEADSGREGETRIGEADSGAGDASPAKKKDIPPEEAGLFDLIRVEIRCFFKINACVRPPYIGKFIRRADKFAQVTQARIDKFISVLSKNEDEFAAKTDIEIGYNDDLLPDMPERGLVLHPKKKKKR